ncbi:hypothetical protein H0H81_002775 [Sphagnurus paluster]|uniref:non-specific serine/threonine protein kinase n=1 Tax=Sphagnurus paluster TaxID=117069 RepID=A0A9P7K6G8_9AGAR|nr:hypothetical protein H0H81_002775 [Sphagnurus paluster]
MSATIPTSTEPIWYKQYAGIESISGYTPGGYHPVDIGDVYHKRYRVLNKLGHGAFATFWLVKDLQSFPRRFLSLKIAIANAKHIAREIQIVFDDFEIKGPNGTHQCIISELCGPDIQYLHKGNVLLYSSKVAHCQSTKELLQYFERSYTVPITRVDKKPFVPSPHFPKRLTHPACSYMDEVFVSTADPSWIHIKICD